MTTPTRTTDPVQLAALRVDVVRGLTAVPKTLPPKWLYDADGSELFEQEITRLSEYYATRTEWSLIQDVAGEIAAATGARTLIELGAGASDKAAVLLGALAETVTTYQPVDISAHALALSTPALTDAYPGLSIQPLVADFSAPLDLPETEGPRLIAFLGGTLGNLLPVERAEFLGGLGAQLAPDDRLLLGIQLVTDPARMLAAYDDAAGVTAQFSRGVLRRINRELGADFDPDAFEHVAYWDAEHGWIEMRLRSRDAQTVTVADPGIRVHFAAGEDLRTEVSAKFTAEGLARELSAVGLDLTVVWSDPEHLVALALAAPYSSLPVS